MKETVTLNRKEQNRLIVLNQVSTINLTVSQAAKLLAFSPRHVWRLLAAYRKEGALALAHGNRGQKPRNALDEGLRKQVQALAESTYIGFNTQHFTERLAEREGIHLSRSTVRRILLSAGISSPRKRRPPKHRSRRERYPQEGMLLQIDGSPHDWMEGRGPWLSLVGAIDDATGKVPYALFRKQEDAPGYFLLLEHIVQNEGIPVALYHDRHSIFELSPDKSPSIEEQLDGKRPLTQFGRLMEELGITSIAALSPQAKGRIERLWGTFQDRLVSELRLAGAATIDAANQVLRDFLPRYNHKFAVPAVQDGSAYRKPGKEFTPDEVFCFKYQRTVGADNVVRFEGYRLQILPSNGRLSYARAKVEVHEKLDGSLAIYYQGQSLLSHPAPVEATVLRQHKLAQVIAGTPQRSEMATVSRSTNKPAPDHPWRQWVYR